MVATHAARKTYDTYRHVYTETETEKETETKEVPYGTGENRTGARVHEWRRDMCPGKGHAFSVG